jgi:hypothetical protein
VQDGVHVHFQIELTPRINSQQILGLGPAVTSTGRWVGANDQQSFLFKSACPLTLFAAAARSMNNPVERIKGGPMGCNQCPQLA